MGIYSKGSALVLVVFVAIFAAACPKRVSIADIEANPGRYANKDVAIAGRVTDSYGINVPGTPIRGGAYKITDGTGSIWVVTEDSVPLKGAELGVSGRIGNGVSWKGKNYGLGLYEKDRRFSKR
jgi:hypothetical protein